MSSTWNEFVGKVTGITKEIEHAGGDIIFYRGHSHQSWKLLPSILRDNVLGKYRLDYIETCLYYDFISNAGDLIGDKRDSWQMLFLMRHHGLLTRLLDWTESFSVALYFAVQGQPVNNPEIWILNPFQLNKRTEGIDEYLINPDVDLEYDYEKAFITKEVQKAKVFVHPIALYPHRKNPRMFAQKGLFTIHGTDTRPLEIQIKKGLYRVPIPPDAMEDARQFLKLAGVNEYTVFPDLDGLARYLREKYDY
jgi:hypothetical protein